jgi:transcriptional regulator with XRE-family HTH domain
MRGRRGANKVDRHIGLRLRSRRSTLQMTQSDLATALGVTFQQVQKYEKGSNRVSASTLKELAETLKVPLAYFFEGLQPEGTRGEGDYEEWVEFLAMPDGHALFKAFRNIEKREMRRALIDLVDRLGKRH